MSGTDDLFLWAEQRAKFPESVRSAEHAAVHRARLRQAALAFLAAREPDGLAADVPPRFRNYQVAAAAFWRKPGRKTRPVSETAAVQIFDRHDRCFAECAERRKLLDAIHALRDEREMLEAEIRHSEPHLGDSGCLFPEYRVWRYRESVHPGYKNLCRKLDALVRALYRGSRLEHLMRSGCADRLYLAVPAGMVAPDELAPEWGLVYVDASGQTELIREAELLECTREAREHLALNIASAARRSVLFSSGIAGSGQRYRCLRPPRRRRK